MEDIKNKYSDIINLSRPKSKYKKMTLANRAGQFASFAAVVGHNDSISEKNRFTYDKLILDEYYIDDLNKKIIDLLDNKKTAEFIYYLDDKLKKGGNYYSIIASIKKYDEETRELVFDNGSKIFIENIIEINIINDERDNK